MSLNWDISKCDRLPREAPTEEHPLGLVTEEFYPKLEAIIWGMMFTGHGWELTDETADKFWARYSLIQAFDGSDFISPEDVYKVVGLHVNVAPETDAKWRKRMFDYEMQKRTAQYNRFVKKLAEENAATEANEGGE